MPPIRKRRVGAAGRAARMFKPYLKRAVRNVLVNSAARVHPAAGLATYGAFKAYDGYKNYKRRRSSEVKPEKRPRYVTRGRYVGRFKKVTKKGAVSTFDSYSRRGVVQACETIGNQSDQDCVYIINEVINSRDLIKYIVAATLRQLIEKAGIRVTSMDCCPFDKDDGTANEINYHISLVRNNVVSGISVTQTKDLLTTDSFDIIVDFFKNHFEQYCAGYGELNNNNNEEPIKWVLWSGPNEGNPIVILSEMFFNETYVDIYGKAELKLQNRTKATGGSEDAENVNNNPLQGMSYMFQGVPKPKGNVRIAGGLDVTAPFARMAYPKGLTTFGGTLFATGTDYREPPPARQFWNCRKAAKVRLEPGDIKTYNALAKKVGNVLKILKSIRLNLDAGATWSTYSIFPVQMVALEDVINADAAETISVQYEVQRTLGVKCYTKEKRFFMPDYTLRT